MCRFFSSKLDRSENINAFVAGLLHDMGKIILDTYFSKLFEAMMKIMKIEKCSFHDAEVRLIGYGHNKIGAYVAKRWNLSDDIVDAIEGHHDPLHCVHPLTDITFLGNMATHKLGVHTMDFEKRKPEDETEEAEEEEGILLDTIERRWNSEPGRLRSLFAEAAAGSDFGRDDEEEEEEKKKEN
jgi:putative nucleotidyltransferase with HDIG domain